MMTKEYIPNSKYIVSVITDHVEILSLDLRDIAIKVMSVKEFRYAVRKLHERGLIITKNYWSDMRSKYYRMVDKYQLAELQETYNEYDKNDVLEILS